MTIVASVKVHDGIALGCDSATQIQGKDPTGNVSVLKIYQNARKLFRFQDLPIGILVYGIGNIGVKSIRTILREFNKENPISPESSYTVQGAADALLQFMRQKYDENFKTYKPDEKPTLGVFVAGYSKDASLGEEWEFQLPDDNSARIPRPNDDFGASWRGLAIPFTRLYFGKDPRAIDELIQNGVDEDLINKVFGKYQTPVVYPGMPLKDAVNFVRFILNTTIGLNSFEIGAPSCSEPLQVAVIEENKFKWIDKPKLRDNFIGIGGRENGYHKYPK